MLEFAPKAAPPFQRFSWWAELLVMPVLLAALGNGLRAAVDPVLGDRFPFITLYPVVAAAVWFGGVRCGLMTILLSLMLAGFFFIQPRFYLTLGDAADRVAAIGFFASSVIIIFFGELMRRGQVRRTESEQRLQSVIDLLPAAVSVTDRDLRYRLVNAEHSKWFNRPAEEIVGRTLLDVLGIENFTRIRPHLERALAGEEIVFSDYLPNTVGGGRWVDVTCRPSRGDNEINGVIILVADVSQRHHAQEVLAEKEREFRAIFELNATGSAIGDPATGRFTRVNQKLCEITGYSSEELLDRTFLDLVHPEDREVIRKVYQSALQSGATHWDIECRGVCKNGSICWLMVRGTIVRDRAGQPVRTLATILDLTGWRENQRRLEESEARLRQAVDAGHFGTWEWLIEENRVTWSDRLFEIHGVDRSTFTGTIDFFRGRVHPDDWERVSRTLRDSIENKAPYQAEYRSLRPTGEVRWLWTTGQVFFQEGRPVKMVGITSDVTERRQIQEQLRESEERLRLAQRAARIGAWDWRLDTGQMVWSEGIYQLLGIPEWQLPPGLEAWMGLVHPTDRASLEASVSDRIRQEGAFTAEFRIIRPGGEVRWLLSLGKVECDERRQPARMLGVCVDITERKKAEELLQSQAQHLEELVRARTASLLEINRELETFSYTVAHDLRGPLRAMSGFASALLDDYSGQLDDTARDYIRRITGAADRMDSLICDVLDYGKITRESFRLEPIELEPLIAGILDSYPALHAGGAVVTLEKPLPTVIGASALLAQCFSNLLVNAVKFVPEGTTPRATVRAEKRDQDRVRIWIEDNGIGIAPEYHERVFGLFQRLNSHYPGTGIGLSIVRRAVERMGGEVGIESTLGSGSRFWIDLNLGSRTDIERPAFAGKNAP